MQTKRISAISIAPAILSLLLAIGVVTVFSACGMKDDGSWMRCHAAQNAVMWIALAMTVVLAIAAFVQSGKAKAVLYVLGAVGSGAAFLVPGTLFPMCMMQTTRCYVGMQPFVRIMAVIILALSLIAALRAWQATADESLKKAR